jgi:hypothetical protein
LIPIGCGSLVLSVLIGAPVPLIETDPLGGGQPELTAAGDLGQGARLLRPRPQARPSCPHLRGPRLADWLVAADVGEWQHYEGETRRAEFLRRNRRRRRFRLGWLANFHRINADRLGNVLECHGALIAGLVIERSPDLPVGILGETDRARPRDALEPGGNIDAVAHQIAVALLNHVADVNADAKFDPALSRQTCVALDHACLHFNRAAHGIDGATELDDASVAGALDGVAMMRGDGGVDQVTARRPRPSGCTRRARRSSALGGDPNGGKTIEHEASSERSNKD